MKYSLRQLEIFVAVSREQSVSRAAEALSLSQSATSTALGEFERQFNLQLFDRIGKTLRINETGQQLLPRAVELLDRAHEIEALLQGHAGFGHMKVGATLTVGNYLATMRHGQPGSRYASGLFMTPAMIWNTPSASPSISNP